MAEQPPKHRKGDILKEVTVFLSPDYARKTFRDDVSGVTFTKGENVIVSYGFNVKEEDLLGVNSALLSKTLLPFDEETRSYVESIQTVLVTSVSLNKASVTLEIGEEEGLVATVLPSNASNKTVSFTSSASNVATVDGSGKVRAISEGATTITVTAGGKTATCMVTVNPEVVPEEPVEPEENV